MAQAVLHRDDGISRLAITVDMLEAMVASGTIEDPARVELIEGELGVCRSVSLAKARLKAKILVAFANQISPEYEVLSRVSIRLDPYNEPISDLCVAKAGVETNVLAPSDCALVIEVFDATAHKDRIIKAPLYAKAGILELWIVDLNTSETLVHRGPNEAGWASVEEVPFSGELIAAFDDGIKVTISAL